MVVASWEVWQQPFSFSFPFDEETPHSPDFYSNAHVVSWILTLICFFWCCHLMLRLHFGEEAGERRYTRVGLFLGLVLFHLFQLTPFRDFAVVIVVGISCISYISLAPGTINHNEEEKTVSDDDTFETTSDDEISDDSDNLDKLILDVDDDDDEVSVQQEQEQQRQAKINFWANSSLCGRFAMACMISIYFLQVSVHYYYMIDYAAFDYRGFANVTGFDVVEGKVDLFTGDGKKGEKMVYYQRVLWIDWFRKHRKTDLAIPVIPYSCHSFLTLDSSTCKNYVCRQTTEGVPCAEHDFYLDVKNQTEYCMEDWLAKRNGNSTHQKTVHITGRSDNCVAVEYSPDVFWKAQDHFGSAKLNLVDALVVAGFHVMQLLFLAFRRCSHQQT